MKLSPEINSLYCEQANMELGNVQKYKLISSFFENKRLPNLAKKFKEQASEEYGHYTKVMDYINDRLGGTYIPVEGITPENTFSSVLDVAKFYLETEIETTNSLESIAEVIEDNKSYIDRPFIDEMLAMQVEEEKSADEFYQQISNVSDIVLYDYMLGE